MSRTFNENTRVQVPAAVHLCRLGYQYYGAIAPGEFDASTNILMRTCAAALVRLNPGMSETQAASLVQDLVRLSSNDDLGRAFYQKITAATGVKYIDFENPDANEWGCTTEFECENPETHDRFRPDITCFVNGLPLAFVEVKIPNNREGILTERARMNQRFANKAFRSFLNVTQLMIFSNNQPYDNASRVPIQGAFYATNAKERAFFNVFREERQLVDLLPVGYSSDQFASVEQRILTHRNCITIRNNAEYTTNKSPQTPTNAILSSMLQKQRFLFLLRFGFAYVEQEVELANGRKSYQLQKHVMRYQQLFATYAISGKLDEGVKSGIIWHTQGSGKTALAYYNVKRLTDYFSKRATAAKFYFIVDRLDLLQQAASEFKARGLVVRTADSREELMKDLASNVVVENASGVPEITVVNIQKFAEDHTRVDLPTGYNTSLQRVFFIDEAHRGYDPKGSFLANLLEADPDAVKIALTGTPLLKSERASWRIFGNYIHTYYYDKSIADGYTLKLMREDIETSYREKITDILARLTDDVEVRRGDVPRQKIIEHESYLNGLLDYIFHDMRRFRLQHDSPHIAGMIVCETNPQARALFRLLNARAASEAAESGQPAFRAQLILHDEGDKETRKGWIATYKKTEDLDFLVVNNMLLTGFDAPRLKRLYLCRKLDGHNLLQALTRVNRPYRDFKYGYVVDFANIKDNFVETNNRYLEELNRTTLDADLPADVPGVGETLLVSQAEVVVRLNEVKDALFLYDATNLEVFREQLDGECSKDHLYELKRKLEDAKALANQVRSFGDEETKALFEQLKPETLPQLLAEVTHRIDRINLLENTEHAEDIAAIINEALAELEFTFSKRGEEELEIVYNDLRDRFRRVRDEFDANFDKKEDKFVSLSDEFRRYFREKGFQPHDVAEARASIGYMDSVMTRIREINRLNNMLKRKYEDDERFVRIHKRIREENSRRTIPPERAVISQNEREIAENLLAVKHMVDERLYWNVNVMENEPVFNQDVLRSVSEKLLELKITASREDRLFIRDRISEEYLNRYYELAV